MEYSIQEVAKAAGTTSRTLRHYDSVGVLTPVRIGANGYRYYDDRSLVRLQRILLLRELGLGLDAIAQVLAAQDNELGIGESAIHAEAKLLESHLELLRGERDRIDRQIGAVGRTVQALKRANTNETQKEALMSTNMFDGFDHTEYKEEVERRWGADAYAKSDAWWRGLGRESQQEWMAKAEQLGIDWIAAAERGVDPNSEEAQAFAARHAAWLRGIPGTPSGTHFAAYLTGLGEMYVADPRFAKNYGGVEGATFVRDALRAYVESGGADNEH
ncbi:MerR family transcriptional regulator [Leucobacter denitrificans]|uniref:MerR family transcriptional regulator n=1 Tax=Leucobacter denitrificans TaxID=683042 RepID=A0A7G9S338_9MICO|nr:MerR family transcriptional regulator [Leucobacter denitrificans]QNN62263.1 MerR family transcriptional regulator [Leucobacter denitrificans]